ncbi:MAG: hypothetical protein ACLFQ9_09615 [Desulfobacterales bacterium]
MKTVFYIFLTSVFAMLPSAAAPVLATQGHGGPEGVYVHQFSHIFFIFAMGILIYWLRSRNMVRERGWWYLQYACLFFLLWSADAFSVHLLEEQLRWIRAEPVDSWGISIQAEVGGKWLAWFYYIIKLDHLLCVPGMVFLFMGLRRLSLLPDEESGGSVQGEDP